MKTYLLLAAIITLSPEIQAGIHIPGDSLSSDSLPTQKVEIWPGITNPMESFGSTVYPLANERILSNTTGLPVFYALYGQVPNLSAPVSFQNYDAAWRGHGAPLLIVDGIPYNSTIGSITNVNGFEYSGLTVLNSMMAASPYGFSAGNGAFVLKSKTGEGLNKPTFDFNNYSTYSWNDPGVGVSGTTTRLKELHTSSSIAYSQDFGKIDTRISFNHLATPYSKRSVMESVDMARYNFKINTGVKLGKTFSARLIADKTFNADEEDAGKDNTKYFNSLLQLKYSPIRWLSLTSNASLQKKSADFSAVDSDGFPLSFISKDERQFLNAFVNIDKEVLTGFSISPYAGVQFTNQGFDSKFIGQNPFTGNQGTTSDYRTYNTRSEIFGLNTNLKHIWYTNILLRNDRLSLLANDEKKQFSASSSFVFSKLIQTGFLTFGKLRASYGKGELVYPEQYPYTITEDVPTPNSKTSYETGLDITALKGRLNFSFTYFHDNMNAYLSPTIPTTGYIVYDNTFNNLTINGIEFVVGGLLLKNRNLHWTPSLLFGNHILQEGDSNWAYSLLNQLQWKNLNFNFLFDTRNTQWLHYSVNNRSFTSEHGSYIKLREISAGYSIPVENSSTFKQVNISLVGRNLWTILNDLSSDPEPNRFATPSAKSISVNISLTF